MQRRRRSGLGVASPPAVGRRDFLRMLALVGGSGAVVAFLGACVGPQATLAVPTRIGTPGTEAQPTAKRAASQVLRLWNTEPLRADPGAAVLGNETRVVMALYDGLLTYGRDGKAVPLVAERWDISGDGLTYTFYLRDGVRWTDGRPVTANDFEYAWKRLASPEFASEYAHAAYPIKGAADYNTGRNPDPNSVAVKAIDDRTLEVELAEPAAYFLPLVATWSFVPIPRWAVDKSGEKWVEPGNNVSNGPFKLDSWKHDQEMVAVRNDAYWGPKPALEKIVWTITADPQQTSLPAFENDELDVSGLIPAAEIDRLRGDAMLSKQVQKFPVSNTHMLFFDTSNTGSPVSKPEVRRALYLAIDHDRIARDGFKGLYDPAPTVTPPGIAGHFPGAAPTGGVAEAKQQLAAAGYADGKGFPQIKLTWPQNTDYDLVAQILQQMWKQNLGIDVQLERMEARAHRAFFGSLSDRSIHYDLYMWLWGSDYEDPYNWFNILWHSDQDFYRIRWKNAHYDDLVERAAGESDQARRKQMYEQAEQILMNEMPILPLYHGANNFLVKPHVRDLHWPRVASTKFLQDVAIAQK